MIKRIVMMNEIWESSFDLNKFLYEKRKAKQEAESNLAKEVEYGQNAESQFISDAVVLPVAGGHEHYGQPQWDPMYQPMAVDWNANGHNAVYDPMSVMLVVGMATLFVVVCLVIGLCTCGIGGMIGYNLKKTKKSTSGRNRNGDDPEMVRLNVKD